METLHFAYEGFMSSLVKSCFFSVFVIVLEKATEVEFDTPLYDSLHSYGCYQIREGGVYDELQDAFWHDLSDTIKVFVGAILFAIHVLEISALHLKRKLQNKMMMLLEMDMYMF